MRMHSQEGCRPQVTQREHQPALPVQHCVWQPHHCRAPCYYLREPAVLRAVPLWQLMSHESCALPQEALEAAHVCKNACHLTK